MSSLFNSNKSFPHPPVVLIDTSHVSLGIRCSSCDELSSRPTSPAISNVGVYCRSRPNSACDSVELNDAKCHAQVELLESISNPKPLSLSSVYNNPTISTPVALKFPVLPHNHVVDDNESDTIRYMEDLRKNRVHARTLVDDDTKSLSPSMRTTASSTASSTHTLRRLPIGRIVGQFENDNLRIERCIPVASKKNPTPRQKAPVDVPANPQVLTPVRPPVTPAVDSPVAIRQKYNPELERYREYDPSAKRLPLVYRVVRAKNQISKALQRKPKTRPTTNPNPTPEAKPSAPLTTHARSNSIKSTTASILRKPHPQKEVAGIPLKSFNPTRIRKVTFGSAPHPFPNTAALTSSSRAIENRADRCRSVSFSGFANMSMGVISPSPDEENDDLDPATREATLVANHFVGRYSF